MEINQLISDAKAKNATAIYLGQEQMKALSESQPWKDAEQIQQNQNFFGPMLNSPKTLETIVFIPVAIASHIGFGNPIK